MSNMSKGLDVVLIRSGTLPIPDANAITITASGTTI
jgi:hypothetical protein